MICKESYNKNKNNQIFNNHEKAPYFELFSSKYQNNTHMSFPGSPFFQPCNKWIIDEITNTDKSTFKQINLDVFCISV